MRIFFSKAISRVLSNLLIVLLSDAYVSIGRFNNATFWTYAVEVLSKSAVVFFVIILLFISSEDMFLGFTENLRWMNLGSDPINKRRGRKLVNTWPGSKRSRKACLSGSNSGHVISGFQHQPPFRFCMSTHSWTCRDTLHKNYPSD